jgi:hypothetical protein
VRSPIRLVALPAALALVASLLPADASAQGRRGGSRGGAARVARPVTARPAVRPIVRSRPYYRSYRPYRSYYRYRPYYYGFYRSYPFWGAYGWSPYWAPYWGSYYYGYGYGYGYPYWGGYYRRYDPNDALGAARLQVTPRETEVFVDGYFAGVVDDFDGFSQRLRLEPGEHEVTLFLEGHRPLTRRMLFTVGQTFKVQHEMEPLGAGEPPPQRPVPTAKPAAPARTRYNPPGTAPRRAGEPAADPDREVDVDVIEPNEPREVRPRGERSAPPDEARGPSGTLSIRVQPEDAEVLIDGEPWARSNGERLVVALAPGVHRLEVRKGGHETYSGLVRIRPGGATTLNVALAPAETR